MPVTIITVGVLGTRMMEREDHKIYDHATHSDNEYQTERTVTGLTKRQLHKDSYTRKDSSLNACNYLYGWSLRYPNGGTRRP